MEQKDDSSIVLKAFGNTITAFESGRVQIDRNSGIGFSYPYLEKAKVKAPESLKERVSKDWFKENSKEKNCINCVVAPPKWLETLFNAYSYYFHAGEYSLEDINDFFKRPKPYTTTLWDYEEAKSYLERHNATHFLLTREK